MKSTQQNFTFSRILILATLIISGEVIFFLPFLLPRIFKPTLLEVFQISNMELGFYFSIYGFVALGSYFIGGPLADRFSPRKLMSAALLLTATGGVFLSTIPPSSAVFWIYGFWGGTTILLFWASLMRTTRLLGGENAQGKAFGILDGGRGLVSALISLGGIYILASFLPAESSEFTLSQKTEAFKNVIWFFTGAVIFTSVLVFFVLGKLEENKEALQRKKVGFKEIYSVMKMPEVWLQALIILCAYSGYRVTDDISLLASDVLNYSDVESAKVGSLALWLRPLAAITAGFTADRFKASSVSLVCFGLMILGGGIMVFNPAEYSTAIIILVVSSTSLGVYAMRGLYFAIMGEAKIPLAVTGTVVGLASVVGYLPDIYMAPLMGYFLDKHEGLALGHQYVFGLLIFFSIIGIAAVLLFRRRVERV